MPHPNFTKHEIQTNITNIGIAYILCESEQNLLSRGLCPFKGLRFQTAVSITIILITLAVGCSFLLRLSNMIMEIV